MTRQPTMEELWTLVQQQRREIEQLKARQGTRQGRTHRLIGRGALLLTAAVLALSPGLGRASGVINTWVGLPNMPEASDDLAAATGLDGRIYAFGGADTHTGTTVPYVQYYDSSLPNQWGSLAMPTPRVGLAAATAPNGLIYTMGGEVSGGIYPNVLEAYNPSTNNWLCSTGDANPNAAWCLSYPLTPMPTARYSPGALTAPDGKIYVIGGGTAASVLGVVEAYNPTANTWTCSTDDTAPLDSSHCSSKTLRPMPTPRRSFGTALGPDGLIYVMGGYTSPNAGSGTYLDIVEAYNPSTNSWICSTDDGAPLDANHCSSKTIPPMPTAREYLAAATGPDGRIYTIEGLNASGTFGFVEIYDTAGKAWAALSVPAPTKEYALAATTGLDGRIYALGGANGTPTSQNNVYAYTSMTGTYGSGTIGVEGLAPGTGVGTVPPSYGSQVGVYGGANASNGYGVYGTNAKYVGVYGHGIYGVNGTGTYGVLGSGTYGVYGSGSGSGRGGVFSGGAAQVQLKPSTLSTHPATGQVGDVFLDSTGKLWFYTITDPNTSPPATGWKWVQLNYP